MDMKSLRVVCFICEWNEGRSPHLEMSVRLKLKAHGSTVETVSAGFSQADGINPLRKAFLLGVGVPVSEVDAHKSTIFGKDHLRADLFLVAELSMKEKLLGMWPELKGRVMTVKGFAQGMTPDTENISNEEARMEDAGGKGIDSKLELYVEHEKLARQVAERILDIDGLLPKRRISLHDLY